MSKLVVAYTKKDADPWVLFSDALVPSVFTPEEKNTIIIPFITFAKSLLGLIPASFTESIVGNVYTYSKDFDSIINLQAGLTSLTDTTNPVIAAKNSLMVRKLTELGIQPYTSTTQIIP